MKLAKGFTLIELITVIVILGIIAITVIPRFAKKSNIEARGYYDATLAVLQYAQKTAVAQRRRVCVRITGPSMALTIATTFGGTTCTAGLTGPDGTSPYTLTAPTGITPQLTLANFDFLPSGVAVNAGGAAAVSQTFSVSKLPGKTITIDGATGYVYSN